LNHLDINKTNNLVTSGRRKKITDISSDNDTNVTKYNNLSHSPTAFFSKKKN
jgi:hypothetical protein